MNDLNRIIKCLYVKGKIRLTTSMLLSGGEEENTDKDILRDWHGQPFLSASSQAGAMRSFLRNILSTIESKHSKQALEILFGKSENGGKNSTQSLVNFHDAYSVASATIENRDGVKLDYHTKTAVRESKYDYETLAAGQIFQLQLEVLFRERHRQHVDECLCLMHTLINALQSGQISLGAKKNRGLGKIALEKSQAIVLDMEKSSDIDRWIDFSWDTASWPQDLATSLPPVLDYDDANCKIVAKFKLPYSILIRSYSTDPNAPDVSHIVSANKSIIPGSSWNGALRHAIFNVGRELGICQKTVKKMIEDIFGHVDESKSTARASEIVINETVIKDSKPLVYSRNKIDRFTGGTVETALFDQQAEYSDAELELEILLRPSLAKEKDESEKKKVKDWKIALVLLALRDMENGIQAIGGETSIGRGILRGIGTTVAGEDIDWDKYGKDLAQKISQLER